MDKLELIEHIPGEHVHTFLFTNDVKLTMADIKPNQYGEMRAKVEAWYGDTYACAGAVTLGDPESRAKFIYYTSQRVDQVDWYEVLRLATDAVAQHLHARATRQHEQQPRKWISLPELMARAYPHVVEVVPGILHAGVTILISSPKLGKTRLMLDMAIAVAQGGTALGKVNVDPGDVLYLCLEDLDQLLQERVRDMLQGDTPPPRMDCASRWSRFDVGVLADLDEWLQAHPEAKLVVIDIFQRVKPLGKGNRNAYETDYEAVAHVLELGKKYLHVAIVVVHHTNRSKHVEHFIDRVNGSRAGWRC
jgi:RecA-family ATPase